MKLVIAGGRTLYPDISFIDNMINHFNIEISEIVSGGAKGVDNQGERYAKSFANYDEMLIIFPADWDKFGKGAGHIRNNQMAKYADALLLIWDGESRGSANMKKQMETLNKPVFEVILKPSNNTQEPEL